MGARGAAAGPGRAAKGQQRTGGPATRPPPSQRHQTPGELPCPRRAAPAPTPPPGESRGQGDPAELPRPRAHRAGRRGAGGTAVPDSPGRDPPCPAGSTASRPIAGPRPRPAPRPCPRGRRGGRRGVPRPPTSPFVSGCSSSVRLGLATRVSLAGREAEVLQQQLLNRQWLPWLPPPPPSGAGGRRGRVATRVERGPGRCGGDKQAEEPPLRGWRGDPGSHSPPVLGRSPSPAGAGEGRKGRSGGGT